MFSKILLRQLYLPMAGIMFVFTWMSVNWVLPGPGITLNTGADYYRSFLFMWVPGTALASMLFQYWYWEWPKFIKFPAVALVSTAVALWLALMAAGPLPG